jgi:hypothetical protein
MWGANALLLALALLALMRRGAPARPDVDGAVVIDG